MKKILCLILVMTVFLLTGCKNKGYTELSYAEVLNKLENKDTFVIVFGSDTCSACANYEITMKNVINKNDVEIFYLNINALDKETYANMYSKFVVTSTPTTVFIKEGKETTTYDRIIGSADYKEVVKNLEKHGYIGD